MCEFISWIEHDGKNYFLTKNELNSAKGKELLEYCECEEDLAGHGAIRHYYNFSGGFDKELTDFTNPNRFPTEIVQALKDGLFEGVGLSLDILTPKAQDECNRIQQPARAEYDKIIQPARAEYDKINLQAWAEYNKIRQQAQVEYGKIERPAWVEYKKIERPAWAGYKKIQQPARAEYDKIQQQAFWKLFKDPSNRIEAWR